MNGFIVSSFWSKTELDNIIIRFDKEATIWTLILERDMDKISPSTFMVFTKLSSEQVSALIGVHKIACINSHLRSNPVLDEVNQVKEKADRCE